MVESGRNRTIRGHARVAFLTVPKTPGQSEAPSESRTMVSATIVDGEYPTRRRPETLLRVEPARARSTHRGSSRGAGDRQAGEREGARGMHASDGLQQRYRGRPRDGRPRSAPGQGEGVSLSLSCL